MLASVSLPETHCRRTTGNHQGEHVQNTLFIPRPCEGREGRRWCLHKTPGLLRNLYPASREMPPTSSWPRSSALHTAPGSWDALSSVSLPSATLQWPCSPMDTTQHPAAFVFQFCRQDVQGWRTKDSLGVTGGAQISTQASPLPLP